MKIARALAALCLAAGGPAVAYWVEQSGAPLVYQRLDPLVFPGDVSPHTHTFVGNSAIKPTLSWQSLRSAISGWRQGKAYAPSGACTTTGLWLDGSATWSPRLYERMDDGTFTALNMTFVRLYHYSAPGPKERAAGMKVVKPFPKGLRFLAGSGTLFTDLDGGLGNTSVPQAGNLGPVVNFVCLSATGGYSTNTFPDGPCPWGLRMQIQSQQCWDGVNLDSKDHQSHMAYPDDDGDCPTSHPVHLARKFDEWVYDVSHIDSNAGFKRLVLANGDMYGYSFHMDFVSGEDPEAMAKVLEACNYDLHPNDKALEFLDAGVGQCAAMRPYFSKPLVNAQGKQDFGVLPSTDGCVAPTLVQGEEVSGSGLKWLPGCNPIRNGQFKQTDDDMADCLPTLEKVSIRGSPGAKVLNGLWKSMGFNSDGSGGPSPAGSPVAGGSSGSGSAGSAGSTGGAGSSGSTGKTSGGSGSTGSTGGSKGSAGSSSSGSNSAKKPHKAPAPKKHHSHHNRPHKVHRVHKAKSGN